MFDRGQIYKRSELHNQWGGSRQSGICPSKKHSLIFIFTGQSGQQHGYKDGWSDNVFLYTGEGQSGDMEFNRGNSAILNHIKNGKDLYLFSQEQKAYVKFIDQMVCIGFHKDTGKDTHGVLRSIIVFELSPLHFFDIFQTKDQSSRIDNKSLNQLTLEELRIKSMNKSVNTNSQKQRLISYQNRSRAIKLYALKRANGNCESCQKPAPFKKSNGDPFLEVHHTRRLSDGGPDHPHWVIAICPNCHREAHYSEDAKGFNESLVNKVKRLEQ